MFRRGCWNSLQKRPESKVIYSTYESNESMYTKLKTYKDGGL